MSRDPDVAATLARLAPTPRQVPPGWDDLLVPDGGRLTLAGNKVQIVGGLALLVGAAVRWLSLMSPAPDWLTVLAPGAALMVLGSALRLVGGGANRAARTATLSRAKVVAAAVTSADPLLTMGRGFGRLRLVYATADAHAHDMAWVRALAQRIADKDLELGPIAAEWTGGREARLAEVMIRASALPGRTARPGDVLVGVEVAPGELRVVPAEPAA